jgi:hypothetical protein
MLTPTGDKIAGTTGFGDLGGFEVGSAMVNSSGCGNDRGLGVSGGELVKRNRIEGISSCERRIRF